MLFKHNKYSKNVITPINIGINFPKIKRGFTFIEILITTSIIAVIFGIIIFSFNGTKDRELLKKDTNSVVAVLDEAKSKTLSFKDSSQYGVHFEEFDVIEFAGTSYSSGDLQNQITNLDPAVHISSILLNGNSTDVIFDRLTGETSQYGTITLTLKNNPSVSKTITIYSTGVIESN